MKTNFTLQEVSTYAAQEADVIQTAAHMMRCQLGFGLIARSSVRVRAAKTTAQEYALTFGYDLANVAKITLITNARSYNYAKSVNRAIKANGEEPTFKAEERKGFETIVDPIIVKSEKDGALSVNLVYKTKDSTKFTHTYISSDHALSAEEVAWIEAHIYKAPASAKQLAAGIAEEDITRVVNYKFPNLLAIGTTSEVQDIWDSLPIVK